jgi:hypothetical protein
MGIPDGAHTHGSGGLGTAVLVLLGAALAVKLAGPVVTAAAELVHILLVLAAVLLGLAAAALVAFIAYRVRRRRSLPVVARVLQPPRAGPGRPEPPRAAARDRAGTGGPPAPARGER